MKNSKHIFILFFILQSYCFAQTETDTLKVYSKPAEPLENIQLKFDEFEFYRDKYYSDIHTLSGDDKSTLQLRTEFMIRHSTRNNYQTEAENFYFLSPLYNKHIEDSKFNPVRYLLGMAQLGAAGYLAYRHIKKYGFID